MATLFSYKHPSRIVLKVLKRCWCVKWFFGRDLSWLVGGDPNPMQLTSFAQEEPMSVRIRALKAELLPGAANVVN